MADQPFLHTISVSKLYPGEKPSGVKAVNIAIEQGKITAIIGASGSGKSTLLKLLFGLHSPDEGEVQFKGERIWGPEEKLIPGHDAMRMVTQHTDDLNLFAKVIDNISVLLPNTNLKAKKSRTEKVLKQLNMMQLAERRVFDLSGGEKQRVAIARALVTRPQVLLLDEPFNQVDASFREGLQQDIRNVVKQTGLTVIMVSHDPAEVLSMADELIVLKDGVIMESGHPQSLYRNPKHLYTAQLLANCNVLKKPAADILGLTPTKRQVVIYPEWIKVVSEGNQDWKIKQVLFKGFYEDLLVEKDGITLRVFNALSSAFQEGEMVGLEIGNFLEY